MVPAVDHLRQHLNEEQATVLDWLVLPLTLEDVAERLGPGYTRRWVEYRYHAILERFGIEHRNAAARVALLRLYYGLEPCWCYFDERRVVVRPPRPGSLAEGPGGGLRGRARQPALPTPTLARVP